MTQAQTSPQGPVVKVKPEPNIYTILLIIAIVASLAALIVMIWNLTVNYGMSFGEVFSGTVQVQPKQ